MRIVSEETKRKISESLKAFYAAHGAAKGSVEATKSTIRSRNKLIDDDSASRMAAAKATPGKTDDIKTAASNLKRKVSMKAYDAKDYAKAKKLQLKVATMAATPSAKGAVESLKSDLRKKFNRK